MKSLLLGLLIFLVGCSAKQAQTSVNTSFVFTSGLSALESQTGGIILYGRNKSNFSDAFTMVIDGDANQIELNNGTWEFMAVSWTGYNANLGTYGNPFEGEVRCAKVGEQVFSGGESELSFTLNQATCRDTTFGLSETRDAAGIKLSKFYSCTNEEAFDKEHNDGGTKCFNSIGNSFQVTLLSRGANGSLNETYKSRCIVNDHANKITGVMDSVQAHQLRLPIFFPDYPGPAWSVQVFEDSGCNTQNSSSTFIHPYAGEIQGRLAMFDSGDEALENIFMVHTPVCGSVPGQQPIPFTSHLEYYDEWNATNVSEQYKVICTKEQMVNYMTANSALDYKLGRNIDFGGSSYSEDIVGGVFSGRFLGSGHTLSNFTISATTSNNGLFSQLGTSSSISDLNINGVTINCAGGTNVGVLAGNASLDSLTNIHLSNIDIDIAGCSYVGGMIGNITYASIAKKLSVDGLSMDISGEGTEYIGGGFGYLGSALMQANFSNITITQNGAPATQVSYYGGVAGVAENGYELSDIRAIQIQMGVAGAPIDNVQYIGGAFGRVNLVNYLRDIQSTSQIHTGAAAAYVGGVAGTLANISSGEASNLISSSQINAQGDYAGGVLGYSDANSNIRVVRSFGNLNCANYCGGITGYSSNSSYRMLYSNVAISPISNGTYTKVGGITGMTFGSDNYSGAQNDGDIIFPGTSVAGASNIGGIFGYYGSSNYVNYLVNHGDVRGNGINIAGILGYISTDTTVPLAYILNSGTITNDSGDSYPIMGAYGDAGTTGLYDIGGVGLYHSGSASGTLIGLTVGSLTVAQSADLTNLIGFSDKIMEGDGTNPIELRSIYRLKQLGGAQRLGNRAEPFLISTVDQWNMIEDESIFMSAHFSLTQDLDFSGEVFNSIGSGVNPFRGSFRGNNFGLNNILINYGESLVADYPGTVSIAASSNQVTGDASALFTSNIQEGDQITIAGKHYTVSQVSSDTLMFLNESVTTAVTNATYRPFQETNIGIFAATENAVINSMYEEDDEYDGKLFIRNLDINVTATPLGVYVGGLVGLMSGQNSIRKITLEGANIDVTPSTSLYAYVGGLVGQYDLVSEWNNYWNHIDIFDSTISGATTELTYVGGVVGKISASVPTGSSAYPYHEFRTFRVRDTNISGFSAAGIAQAIYTDINSSTSFEELWVSSTTGSTITASNDYAGGLFGSIDTGEVHQYAVTGYDISSNGFSGVGGIAGIAYGSHFAGGYVQSKVSIASGDVGCLLGRTSNSANNGLNVTLENSYGMCSDVTNVASSGTWSYAVASTSGFDSPTGNDVFYLAPADESLTGITFLTQTQLFDESYMSSNYPSFQNGDPWLWDGANVQPRTVMEVLPQYFFE